MDPRLGLVPAVLALLLLLLPVAVGDPGPGPARPGPPPAPAFPRAEPAYDAKRARDLAPFAVALAGCGARRARTRSPRRADDPGGAVLLDAGGG